MIIQPKNWDTFQQYKDRKPQWIKFHRDLLTNYAYSSVQIGTKATAPLLWLLASEYDDGVINASLQEISFRIHIEENTVKTAIRELLKAGFFIDLEDNVQNCTEAYKNVPREEKRREREETEKESNKPKLVTDPKSKTFIEAERIAEYLFEKILTVSPNHKKPSINNWAKEIDKMLRLDNRTADQLYNCINWIYSPQGKFWQSNILSGKKLRDKFDTMNMQASSQSGSTPQSIYDKGTTATELIRAQIDKEKRSDDHTTAIN